MRTSFLLAALTAFVPAAAHAQFGMKGGVAFSTIDVSNGTVDFSNQTGFVGGVSFGLSLGGTLGLQPELLYVEKGGESGNAEVSLSYLEIPVLLKLSAATGQIQPFLVGGPYVNFKLSDGCSVTQASQCLEEPKNSDFGLAFGAGLRMGGTTGLTLELRWDRGLTNINSIEDGFDAKNRAVMILAGLSF